MENDILQELSSEEINKLRDLYEQHLPYAAHVYSLLSTAIKWKISQPEKKHLIIFAPRGNWITDGTFIAVQQCACCYLFVFTLDKKCKRLCEALKNTKKIDWNNPGEYYALHKDHIDPVLKVMEEINVPIIYETKTNFWWMPSEEAALITFKCPDEYYIQTLKPENAPIINELWPHKYKGSVGYISTFIEMNGGHGVFTKADNQLVSWILKSHMGTLALLQTVEEHKRKGLGSLVTKSLSKEIGLDGHCPIGTVIFDNAASEKMFHSIGFKILDWCSYVGIGKDKER